MSNQPLEVVGGGGYLLAAVDGTFCHILKCLGMCFSGNASVHIASSPH